MLRVAGAVVSMVHFAVDALLCVLPALSMPSAHNVASPSGYVVRSLSDAVKFEVAVSGLE